MKHINLAYYKEEDWDYFISCVDDRDSMHETWKDWHKAFSKVKKDLMAQGFIVNDFIVNIDELIIFCKTKGIANDGKARSEFVSRAK